MLNSFNDHMTLLEVDIDNDHHFDDMTSHMMLSRDMNLTWQITWQQSSQIEFCANSFKI